MQQNQKENLVGSDPELPQIKIHHPSSPAAAATTPTPTAGARRKIGVAVDLSDESAYAVRWAVQQYIRPGDAVVLLHVSPTDVLFGADWGSVDLSINTDPNFDDTAVNDHHHDHHHRHHKLDYDFDAFTASKAAEIARPLQEANIPYKIHIVKDHDMRERLCLEVERLCLNAVIMGSRGTGAVRRGSDGRLGSVSDYCVRHCVCPVVVVRYPEDKDPEIGAGAGPGGGSLITVALPKEEEDGDTVIEPAPVPDEHKKECI